MDFTSCSLTPKSRNITMALIAWFRRDSHAFLRQMFYWEKWWEHIISQRYEKCLQRSSDMLDFSVREMIDMFDFWFECTGSYRMKDQYLSLFISVDLQFLNFMYGSLIYTYERVYASSFLSMMLWNHSFDGLNKRKIQFHFRDSESIREGPARTRGAAGRPGGPGRGSQCRTASLRTIKWRY